MSYITPSVTPASTKCWRLPIPDDENMLAALLGQLIELTKEYNWESIGGITALEASQIWQDIYFEFSIGRYCLIGSMMHYVSANPPSGMLECDGTQYLRVDYPDLYSILPVSLIVDPDNFITPDMRDQFMLGSGTNFAPEDTGGEVDHTLTVGELAAHSHNSNYPTFAISIKTVGAPNIESGGNPPITPATSVSGNDEAHNNMPPYTAWKIGIVAR